MKWFLQFWSLGSVILYTLLVIIDNRMPDGIVDKIVVSEAHSNQHPLSAWGNPKRSPASLYRGTRARPCTHKSRLVSSGWSVSALPPEADIRQRIEHVCFVPKAVIL